MKEIYYETVKAGRTVIIYFRKSPDYNQEVRNRLLQTNKCIKTPPLTCIIFPTSLQYTSFKRTFNRTGFPINFWVL